MNRVFRIVLVFYVLSSACNTVIGQESAGGELFIQPYVKYRQENLRWSIAGDVKGQNPNIYSELKWKKIRGPQIGALIHKGLSEALSVQFDISYMAAVTGRVTDADYREDNRQGNFYYEKLRADKGYTLLFQARLQYRLYARPGISIIPFLGYINKYQHLYMLDNDIPLVEGKKLESTYNPNWNGASLGSVFLFDVKKLDILFELEGHLTTYYAEANWNLREEFTHPVSFKHRATGKGVTARLYLEYPVGHNLYAVLNTDASYLKTGEGTDKTYYQSGVQALTQLNAVINTSFGIGGGLKYKFF